jgi:hypothetical protein
MGDIFTALIQLIAKGETGALIAILIGIIFALGWYLLPPDQAECKEGREDLQDRRGLFEEQHHDVRSPEQHQASAG